MPIDPLSDVLSLLKPRSYMFGGFDAGGDWSICFSRYEGIKCYAVSGGDCWMAVEGVAEPLRLREGDCFLLVHGRPFRMASDLALPSVDAHSIFSTPLNGALAQVNGGGGTQAVGGYFALTGSHADILLKGLPPIVHLRSDEDKAALRWSVERIRQELRDPQPGGYLVIQHLTHMMLVQALRLHLAEGTEGNVGWLFALSDQKMRASIAAIHGNPAHRWTLQTLAERAGMSRSGFAQRFKETVGQSPMDYLTRWRMLLAGDRLESSREPVSAIALSLGYESESAFSTAFRRTMGCSPRQYGRSRGAAGVPRQPVGSLGLD